MNLKEKIGAAESRKEKEKLKVMIPQKIFKEINCYFYDLVVSGKKMLDCG